MLEAWTGEPRHAEQSDESHAPANAVTGVATSKVSAAPFGAAGKPKLAGLRNLELHDYPAARAYLTLPRACRCWVRAIRMWKGIGGKETHPAGIGRSATQIKYCPSWFLTTTNCD
jgi:hypothetical protein